MSTRKAVEEAQKAKQEVVDQAVKEVRPLTATQSRNLTKLIQNDFETLRQQMLAMHKEQVNVLVDEVGGVDETTKERLIRQAREVIEDHNADIEAIVAEARRLGFTLQVPEISTWRVQITNDAVRERRVKAIRDKAAAEWAVMEATLNSKRLACERKVLIASISGSAEDLLAAIPTAQEMMLLSAQERVDREIQ